MSDKIQFIFSTRYLGEGSPFVKVHNLDPATSIYVYLRDYLMKPEVVLESIRRANWSMGDLEEYCLFMDPNQRDESAIKALKTHQSQHKENHSRLLDSLISKGVLSEIKILKEEIEHCEGMAFSDKLKSRFSYYKLKNEPNTSVYAVPHLDWLADNEWIIKLIDWSKQLDSSEDTELYLVLHDKDVPGYRDKPYKYLTAKQVSEVLGVELGVNEDVCRYQERLVHIIVFQHTDNDVVDLLNDTETTFQNIKDKLLDGNENAMEKLFSADLPTDFKVFLENMTKDSCALKPSCSVDVCCNAFDKEKLKPISNENSPKYYEYSDANGALFTELTHVKTDVKSSEEFIKFVDYLKEPAYKKGSKEIDAKKIKEMRFPIIIKIYNSFFGDWANTVTAEDDKIRILNHRNRKAMEENLDRVFSFFNNSSIWIRLVDMYDQDAYNRAIAEFNYFDKIGLYDYSSAWENLEYKLRIFSQNHLESTLDGHGNFVTPMVYGNETITLEDLLSNKIELNFKDNQQ